MSGNIIWGILLVLLGLSIISKTIFGFAIPFVRITLALMIIYFGISMLLTSMGYRKPFCYPFSYQKTKIKNFNKKTYTYSTVFSEGTVDLSEVSLMERPTVVELNTVFGNTTLLLNSTVATSIIVNNVFSKTTFPDGTEFSVMGDQTASFGPEASEPALIVKANVVFGNLSITKK
jgi:hypothetical protein